MILEYLLFAAGLASTAIIPQIPLECTSLASTKGWSGPGTYRLHTYYKDNVVALNNSHQNTSVAVKAPVSDDFSQRWTFAEVAEGVYIIASDGQSDGPFLSAIEGCRALLPTADHRLTKPIHEDSTETRALAFRPPYELNVRWTLEFDSFRFAKGSPIVIKSVGKPGAVLDLADGRDEPGNPVITWRQHRFTPGLNQAWLFEYIEKPLPAI